MIQGTITDIYRETSTLIVTEDGTTKRMYGYGYNVSVLIFYLQI
jgi:hypothetical protein